MTDKPANSHYELGILSAAGFPIRYNRQYHTVEAATAARKTMSPSTRLFKVTVEEVE